MSGETPRVPDVPCPKCGDDNVSLRYCLGGVYTRFELCPMGQPGHFHRACRRCDYEWRADEVPLDQAKAKNGEAK